MRLIPPKYLPIYFKNIFIGQVPYMNGKKSIFLYKDKKGRSRKIYWNKLTDKYGSLYYKVYFKNTK